jgi:hypothetical protein
MFIFKHDQLSFYRLIPLFKNIAKISEVLLFALLMVQIFKFRILFLNDNS